MKRRKFTPEFKEQAVKLVLEQNYTVSEAASNLGIGLSTLSKWIRKYRASNDVKTAFPGKGNLSPEQAQLKELQKENARLKRERDILKKAMAYFANPHE